MIQGWWGRRQRAERTSKRVAGRSRGIETWEGGGGGRVRTERGGFPRIARVSEILGLGGVGACVGLDSPR